MLVSSETIQSIAPASATVRDAIFSQLMRLRRLAVGGSPDICIAVLDGIADLSHPCFQGAHLTRVDSVITDAADSSGFMSKHATHVLSTLFGQGGEDDVQGWAPACRGLLIPVFSNQGRGRVSQLDLARAIGLALQNGAHVINISGGELVEGSAWADPMLAQAVKACRDADVLIVAAAGNDGCRCSHLPAVLPSVLAVGAMDEHGNPLSFSNWGGEYDVQGILAPGANVLGAKAGGGAFRLSGTSFAAPLVSAATALMLSLQRAQGMAVSPAKVREALLEGASRCEPHGSQDCSRYLVGTLDLHGACRELFKGDNLMDQAHSNSTEGPEGSVSMGTLAEGTASPVGLLPSGLEHDSGASPPALASPSGATSSAASDVAAGGVSASGSCGCTTSNASSLVFALGRIGYDFGNEARRDGFTQLMQALGEKTPNPYNPEQMLRYLDKNQWDSSMLIWTLNVDLTPVYALEPREPFAADTYGLLLAALSGQIQSSDNEAYVERVSVPGYLTGKTVRLYSGQAVPVVEIVPRGLWFWDVNKLINAIVQQTKSPSKEVREALREFLNRIYYDFRNLGVTSAERALNFAGTNAFQAAEAMASLLAPGRPDQPVRQLAQVAVEKSPFCRMDSDCWDVKLAFFDPENDRRAMKIVRYTIDVRDVMPVTLGEPRVWSAPGF